MLMPYAARRRLVRLAGIAALVCATAYADDTTVPYVPTPQDVVERMLQLGKVGPNDYLIDLGSGDGRIVVTAAKKYGTRGFGVDLDPQRVAEAKTNARKAGVAEKVAFYRRDLFETDLAAATVVTMYLLPEVNMMLRPKLLALKPGTRIVSHDFSMAEWQPDELVSMRSPRKYAGSGGTSEIYLWIVPARVAGTWAWTLPLRGAQVRYELEAQQHYQMLAATVRVAGRPVRVDSATLSGDRVHVAFTADVGGEPVKHVYAGKVEGNRIDGAVALTGARFDSEQDWHASRPR